MNVGCLVCKMIVNSASSLCWTVGLAVVSPFAATNCWTWEFFVLMQLGLGNSTSGETRYVPVIAYSLIGLFLSFFPYNPKSSMEVEGTRVASVSDACCIEVGSTEICHCVYACEECGNTGGGDCACVRTRTCGASVGGE